MSERKVLNKYYPPDFDPSKIPRLRLPKDRQYTVRLMAPCNMRCTTCGEYIYKGKKFNARKETVENEEYLGIKIFRFYIKCPRCLAEITFKTDPANTDYIVEHGATRNFQALKLAEEQAEREAREEEEDVKNNPMKLLEKRTKASKQEMEVIEALEELKDLNKRQANVNFEKLLMQNALQEEEILQKQEDEDEEFIRSVFGKEGNKTIKRLPDPDSGEEEEEAKMKETLSSEKPTDIFMQDKKNVEPPEKKQKIWERSVGSLSSGKSGLQGLVKLKSAKEYKSILEKPVINMKENNTSAVETNGLPLVKSNPTKPTTSSSRKEVTLGGLTLLGAYIDSDASSDGSN
ncbi:coiled-coil domain-containing protein 94-like [Limulus polyphemus]|uniref:Splicing factor YJU2 n=1 Tax=Limulus polyphemus TaxID=6850 RepID=A0ABM1BY29_LIMPO|nr:coiled-coil domain-containing protein 94-like [Limulus polyphemus]